MTIKNASELIDKPRASLNSSAEGLKRLGTNRTIQEAMNETDFDASFNVKEKDDKQARK